MLVFHVFRQHLSGEHQEASGTIATTLLSEEREVHCRLASMILLLFVLVCIALVLQEWQEFQVEVTGSRKLTLTVDLKHRGEPVGETLDPAAACSTSNPAAPRSLCCFRCWEFSHGFWKFLYLPCRLCRTSNARSPSRRNATDWMGPPAVASPTEPRMSEYLGTNHAMDLAVRNLPGPLLHQPNG